MAFVREHAREREDDADVFLPEAPAVDEARRLRFHERAVWNLVRFNAVSALKQRLNFLGAVTTIRLIEQDDYALFKLACRFGHREIIDEFLCYAVIFEQIAAREEFSPVIQWFVERRAVYMDQLIQIHLARKTALPSDMSQALFDLLQDAIKAKLLDASLSLQASLFSYIHMIMFHLCPQFEPHLAPAGQVLYWAKTPFAGLFLDRQMAALIERRASPQVLQHLTDCFNAWFDAVDVEDWAAVARGFAVLSPCLKRLMHWYEHAPAAAYTPPAPRVPRSGLFAPPPSPVEALHAPLGKRP